MCLIMVPSVHNEIIYIRQIIDLNNLQNYIDKRTVKRPKIDVMVYILKREVYQKRSVSNDDCSLP